VSLFNQYSSSSKILASGLTKSLKVRCASPMENSSG